MSLAVEYSLGTGITLVLVPSVKYQRSADSLQNTETLVAVPRSTSIPAFSLGVPVSLELRTTILSSIRTSSDNLEVTAPLTVRSPLIATSLENVLLPAIVCAPLVRTTVLSTANSVPDKPRPSPLV